MKLGGVLDRRFPEFRGAFGTRGSATALALLARWATPTPGAPLPRPRREQQARRRPTPEFSGELSRRAEIGRVWRANRRVYGARTVARRRPAEYEAEFDRAEAARADRVALE